MTTRLNPFGLVVTSDGSRTAMLPNGTVLSVTVLTPAVDSINEDDNVDDSEENVTFITSNFGSEISTVKLVSGTAETNATGVTSSSGSGDFDLPDISSYVIDTVGCPLTTANNAVVATLGDGTDTANLSVTYNPMFEWAVKEVTNVVNDVGSFSELFTGLVTDTSEAYFPTADTTDITEGGVKLTITAATQADPVVLSVVNTLSNNDTVAVKSVVGMTEINERLFTVANQTGTTIELEGEDGTGHTAYSSAGTVGIAGGVVTTSSPTDIAMQFWDASDDTWKPFTLLISTTANEGLIITLATELVQPLVTKLVN